MNIEDFVSYEQATKLKDCGFDWETEYYYEFEEPTDTDAVFKRTSSCWPFNHNAFEESYSAPTLSQAAKWLREKLGWHISVNPEYDKTWYYHICPVGGANEEGGDGFKTYEEALSAGITDLINHI